MFSSYDFNIWGIFQVKVFNHTGHKSLWDWLSKYPEKNKEDWPGWDYNGGEVEAVFADCFACEYDSEGECSEVCPLIWPNMENDNFVDCLSDLFGKYNYEDNLKKRSKIAEKIRDLKVRKGVETI